MQTICRFVARFYDFLWDLSFYEITKRTKIKLLVLLYAFVFQGLFVVLRYLPWQDDRNLIKLTYKRRNE